MLPQSRGGTFLDDVLGLCLRLALPWRGREVSKGPKVDCSGVDCARRTLLALEASSRLAPDVRRTSAADLTAGLALVLPVVFLFNVVAYSSEKSVKERFVLRSALAHEHQHDVRLSLLTDDVSSMFAKVSKAVAPPSFGSSSRAGGGDDDHRSETLILAALPCCLLYTSPSPRDLSTSRMPSSA